MTRFAAAAWNSFGFHFASALAVASALSFANFVAGEETSNETTARRLVEAARQAELAGDIPGYFARLRDAVRIAPDYELARWQLGQVRIDGEWLTVEEAQRRSAADPRQAQYRELRKAEGQTPDGQLALARWCRKNDLLDEARFHWASVLSVDPNNQEALRAVNRRWHNGLLLTAEEIAQRKSELRESKRAAKQWAPRIAKWRRDVSGSDRAQRDAALDEIRSVKTTDVIPSLEETTLGRDAERKQSSEECRQISLAFVEALGKLPDQAATESLVRHAVLSPAPDVRMAAIEHLRPRPQHDYVPLFLSGLAMPIESSFRMRTEPDGSVHYTHSLYREGPDHDWAFDSRRSAVQSDLGGRRVVRDVVTNTIKIGPHTGAEPDAMRQKAFVASRYQYRFGNVAASTEFQVRQANQAAEWLNSRILPALAGATGKDLGPTPKAWWDWWRDQNEYYAADTNEVDRQYVDEVDNYYYGYPPPPSPPLPVLGRLSCFAKGTLVWTKTGRHPIESLELGDLVLSQNIDSGELSYQPVIGRTVRPPSPMLKLSYNNETLRTTLGHPIWIVGIGWRMAKELGDDAILHGLVTSPRVEAIESDGEEEAYNLVVADFNTYFVGETGVLVHDNTPRRPVNAASAGSAR